MVLKNKNIVTGKQSYIFVVVCSNSTTTLLVKLWNAKGSVAKAG